ncbi:hypothetical protein OSTOST_15712, partial [Ostertagia ostertagi]
MRVRRRFPTMESMVEAGFLNLDELKELSKIDLAYNRYWTPIHWALGVSFQALEKKYFETPWARICVQNEIEIFRTNLALLCNFDWVPVPISYPQ